MKMTKIQMGVTVKVEIVNPAATAADLEKIFAYFAWVEEKFSVFKTESEISQINRGEIKLSEASLEMQEIFRLAEKTKQETGGYFDIKTPDGKINPSGLVKGWAIHNAAELIRKNGFENFCVEAGGDIEVGGKNSEGKLWAIGIRNPFKPEEIVKILYLENKGVATSGIYFRGAHIYNPHKPGAEIKNIASLTVIGPNIYEADRFATAAFAMGEQGILFLKNLPGFEAYQIDLHGRAVFTGGLEKYLSPKL
jgi:thiamine biosynthesis lipoprotein